MTALYQDNLCLVVFVKHRLKTLYSFLYSFSSFLCHTFTSKNKKRAVIEKYLN